MAYAPGDVVVGAGGVAAGAEPAVAALPSYSASPPPNTTTPPTALPMVGSEALPNVIGSPLLSSVVSAGRS